MSRSYVRDLFHLVVTFYLFTADDFISILIPNTTCGIALPLADGLLERPASISKVVPRIPLILIWVWTNLLLFNISNQSQPDSVREDAANKPWRPIASGRISAGTIQGRIWTTRLGILGMSFCLGGAFPSLLLQMLTFWYNDLNGGETWILRNFLNAGGYLCFIVGAMQVAVGTQGLTYSIRGLRWLFWTSVITSCTIHIQDLYDQQGDRMRSRRTIPLVFGDPLARLSIATPVVFWSLAAPAFWSSSIFGFLPTIMLGAAVTIRLLGREKSDFAHDKTTFKLWNVWMISIHMLPVWTQTPIFATQA